MKLGRSTPERRVAPNVVAPLEADVREGAFDEILHRVTLAGGDHVVVRLVLLQHQPHGPDVVTGVAPVTARIEVAEHELVLEPEGDGCCGGGDLPGEEVERAAGRLVVVEDPARREQPVAAAVAARDEVTVCLRDAVRRERRERRRLVLGCLDRLAEDLARRRLIEANRRIDVPDRLEHARSRRRHDL